MAYDYHLQVAREVAGGQRPWGYEHSEGAAFSVKAYVAQYQYGLLGLSGPPSDDGPTYERHHRAGYAAGWTDRNLAA